ncbi:beta-N-acetylhexosaminidase [Pedobacter sp. SAFR-022]|uniref:beta-N-acetylhexosaminidase n=1 Tax=Pedobacter sp. SAFR-022 TaxID=3436861 RepID=UPI003F7E3011
MKKAISVLLLAGCFIVGKAQVNIIPKPAELTTQQGTFLINAKTKIVAKDAAVQHSANFLNEFLQDIYGFKLAISKVASPNAIDLSVGGNSSSTAGAYQFQSTKNGVKINGANPEGVFYGVQTLIQLLPTEKAASLSIPLVQVKDEPRFGYRGMHLDVGRHFFPVSYIKKYIDYIALHKMNYFHWHLTEDQGWRIEIKKYPKLTSVGAYRNGTIIGRFPGTGNDNQKYGGFYTQEEIKEVVRYAATRYVTIIPEIEMPGHASAAIAAYPELSTFPEESTTFPPKTVWAGPTTGKQVQQTWGVFTDVFSPSEKTFKFLEDVIDEVVALFPAPYIHIGGDESPKDNWKRSEFCQQLIKEKGLKDEHELQSYFIQRMEKYINSKGKKIIGWDEILEGGLAPNATVMSWRGEKGGIEAAKQKHNVIMTPTTYVYFDYAQTKKEDSVTIGGFIPLRKVYDYEPIPAELNADEHKYVLGAQANLWTEYVKNGRKVEYMVFPRMTALSEVLWSRKEDKNWEDFQPRLKTQLKRFDLWNINYSKADWNTEAEAAKTTN